MLKKEGCFKFVSYNNRSAVSFRLVHMGWFRSQEITPTSLTPSLDNDSVDRRDL